MCMKLDKANATHEKIYRYNIKEYDSLLFIKLCFIGLYFSFSHFKYIYMNKYIIYFV